MSQTTDRELLWLGAIGAVLLALLGGVESAGIAAGLFANGHPVVLPMAQAAATLVRLVTDPGVSAWPTADRRWLPETMAAALAFGIGVAVALLCIGVWAFTRLIGSTGGDGARFAHAGDVSPLRRRGRRAYGIALGRHRGRELVGEPNASVALCGPSQAGKSLAAVVRAILRWDGCLIVLSIKQELLRYTLHAREQRGEVKIFDPTAQTGYRTNAWSPVAASQTWTQARRVAAGLLQIGQEADRSDREPHRRRTAARYLAPLLLAANESGQSMRTVLSWIDLFERKDLRTILRASGDPDAPYALENLESLWKTDARYQGSVIGTLSTGLDAWQEPSVVEATTLPDITPEWLCEGSNTLYIVAPASPQRRLQNLFGGLLVHMIDGALGIAQQTPTGRLSPPLLCALDEVCNAAPLPALGEYASSGAAQGVLLLSVIQDYSQAIETWGRERAATILSNHRAKLFWSEIADPSTFEYIDRLLGRDALLVYGQLPPVWTEQRLLFEDRDLRRLIPAEVVAAESHVGRRPSQAARAHVT